jgi:hypothetical protein
MKYLFALLLLLPSLSNARPAVKITKVKDGKIRTLAAGDIYTAALAVGRISGVTFQVELVGLSTTGDGRLVKPVLDFTPADMTDDSQVQAALEMIQFFYGVKKGKDQEGNIIAKTVGLIFNAAAVVPNPNGVCLGKDLEIADINDPTAKVCYNVYPSDIIQYTP